MSLILAGIDEAGYGPLLGPLSVAMTLFRVDSWTPGEPAPELWKLLRSGVCKKPGDNRKRIAVDDSKKLKLPNDSGAHHPVTHLECGVLAFLASLESGGHRPASDLELFNAVGCCTEPHDWYLGDPLPAPVGLSCDELAIKANLLRRALASSSVAVLAMRCDLVGEAAFNDTLDRFGTKAAATAGAVGRHLQFIWDHHASPSGTAGGPRVVCDRQGGRTDYTQFILDAIPGADVIEEERTPERCRYRVAGRDADAGREMTLLFMPEAESRHLPVALASMLAKLVRELSMARFNHYWCRRLPDLKPTAGYRADAWRWLKDAAPIISAQQRRIMVRRA